MVVLVAYDIHTLDLAGRRRLRRVAKACQSFGQRVQFSLFECRIPPALWVTFRAKLLGIFNSEEDSLRFYFLGEDDIERAEHHGTKPAINFDGPLIF